MIVFYISTACLKVYGMAFEIFLLTRHKDTEINCCLLDCFSPKTKDIIQKVSHRVEMENGHTSQLAKGLNLFLTLTEGQMLQPGPAHSCKVNEFTLHIMIMYIINIPNFEVSQHSVTNVSHEES